jgi:UPF0271 protein
MTTSLHASSSSPQRTCDLNCDLGESPDALATDALLLELISSANIACGGHAGNTQTMTTIVKLAARLNVAIGAHPSYPDRANFGRTSLDITPQALEASIREQITTLHNICMLHGTCITHIKPHGALYHDASASPAVADAIARAAHSINPSLPLIAQARSPAARQWHSQGLTVLEEAFADRTYEPDGTLRARSLPGALLTDPDDAAQHALQLIHTFNPATLCIHSDTPSAISIARAVRAAFETAGIQVQSPRPR